MGDTTGSRLVMVGLGGLLLLALAINVTKGLRADQQPAKDGPSGLRGGYSQPVEASAARDSQQAAAYTRMPASKPNKRDMDVYYSRRAYPGAPPLVPHANFDEKGIGGKSCLGCHRDGGYVAFLKSYAPVTPHPQLDSCTSCHVPQSGKENFRGTEFVAAPRPVLHAAELPGAPPPIPHSLDMRTNCLACHASPATPAAIRTSHPERTNCRQCHAAGDPKSGLFGGKGNPEVNGWQR